MNHIVPKVMVVIVALGLIFASTPAWAKREGSHGSGSQHGWKKDGGQPHGWTQGKKTGWHGSEKPPGLAKKEEKSKGEKSDKKTDDDKSEE